MESLLGGGGFGRFDSATYGTRWTISKRNPSNNGNVSMALSETITTGSGHWLKSLDAPNGGTLQVDSAEATTSTATTLGITGCQAAQGGCVVVPVATDAAASARMIANPLPYDIDWFAVRVRVGGAGGTIYTPFEAAAANILSNAIYIYNGTNYDVWSDTAPFLGNLQYGKSFFVKLLSGGVDQTVDLLIPALGSSTIAVASPFATAPQARVADSAAAAVTDSTAASNRTVRDTRNTWVVNLGVKNVETGWQASAKLGQWPGASTGTDAGDLPAMAPFGQPYLTMVFPRGGETRSGLVDYSTDLRPANGWAGTWNFEVRAQPLGSNVLLRWNAPAQVLAKSRLIDRETGAVIYPTDPNFATGYPMTMDTPVRRLTWEYLGN